MERLSFEFAQAAKQNPHIHMRVLANHTPKGVTLTQARLRSAVFALTVIPRALRESRTADVVHIADPVLSLVGWLIRKLRHKPVVVTVHGLDVSFSSPMYQAYLRLFFRVFDLYLPISTHAKDLLIQKDVSESRIHVITPGTTDRLYNPHASTNQLAEILDMSTAQVQNTHILCTTGRLVPRKGHAWFIREVLPHLPQNTLYVIAGMGPAIADISDAIEDAEQGGRVKILGRVSEQTLQTLYNTIDIFVQPNVPQTGDTEGFGLVLLEAALCNRVVVAAKLEGITDAIVDGKNGMLVQAQNSTAWVQALTNMMSQVSTTLQPREYTLQAYSWPKKIEEYLARIYELQA